VSTWLQRLHERADRPPAEPRVPLATQDGRVIGALEPALAARMAAAGLPLARAGQGWGVAAPLDASLATLARWLHANGLGGRWRDERLPVMDDAGATVGAIERAAVRALGIATHAVHLVGCSADGRVWVQQRAFDKAVDPGLWDTLMGGLVAAGESVETTLARETWEEAGLHLETLRDLQPRGRITVRRPVADGWMVEFVDVFCAVVPDGMTPVNQDGEVACFEALTVDALAQRLRADAFTLEAALVLLAALPQLAGA
jgi:8-oxo-dGTP pyrophosphatase MutT (NUDIX family)